GQVGIAKDGNASWLQLEHLQSRALDAVAGLVRQTVDEIDIDRVDAIAAEGNDGALRFLERLAPVDRRLHFVVEILHADGDPRHAGTGKRGDTLVIQSARIA